LLIDSHAHLDSPRYADDREAMLRRAWEAGVGAVLAIGIGEQACADARGARSAASSTGSQIMPAALRQRRGLSAQHAEIDDACWPSWTGLLAEPEVIACGEIGLDYYHEGAPHDVQREGLIRQLGDCRRAQAADPDPLPAKGRRWTDAWDDLFEILGGSLAAHRPGRRDALLRRRAGSRRGARSTWASWSRLPAI
jgi:TatD DNase family protein